MNPIVLVWSAAKLYEVILFLIFRCWKVWIVLLALEGVMSVGMDQSLIRRTLLYDSTKAEIERIYQEIECEKQQAQSAAQSQPNP